MNKPTFSVIIPCYNHGKFLNQCVDSILNQTYQDFEIIIVDDHSDDNRTQNDIKEQLKKDSRIKSIRHNENKFIAEARNSGVKESSAELITHLDADCYFSNKILEKYIYYYNMKDVDVVYGWYQNFNEKGMGQICELPEWNMKDLLKYCIIPFCGMYKKSDWKKVGGYKSDFWMGGEDYNFWIDMTGELKLKTYRIPEVLMYYRHHEDMVSVKKLANNKDKMDNLIKTLHPKLYSEI